MDTQQLAREISSDLDNGFRKRARLISHSNESGEASEAALREILRLYLPKRCGVDKGFVIDSNTTDINESNQIDVVIYDKNYTPVFEIVDGKRYFPCETVLAVGEVKSSIDSVSKLKDSFNKIESVKSLNRAGAKKMIGAGAFSGELEQEKLIDQISGFIFTASSLTRDNLINEFKKCLSDRKQRLWPNYYCDYNNINIGYQSHFKGRKSWGWDTMNANGLYVTESEDMLFGLFHALLVQNIYQTSIGKPRLLSYYDIANTVEVDEISF